MRRSRSANGFPKSAGVGEAGRLVALPNQWEATGLECDKMSEEAVAFHLRHVIGELKNTSVRSWALCCNTCCWIALGGGETLLDAAHAAGVFSSWGYDLKPFLPIFAQRVVGSEEEKKKFLGDYDRTIADLSLGGRKRRQGSR